MSLESALERFPLDVILKDGSHAVLRTIEKGDAAGLAEFYRSLPEDELLFIKHKVTDPAVIKKLCAHIDPGHNFHLLAVYGGKIVGECMLQQQLGGWKRHIGNINVNVHPAHRAKGLARTLVTEMIEVARECGLERLEAECVGRQVEALKMFGLLGFSTLMLQTDYVKDMKALDHDYILLGLKVVTDEEYAGMG